MRDRETVTERRWKSVGHDARLGWEMRMQRGSRIRILVVDDEPSICKALEIALSRSGYDVMTVESGETATTLLQ